MNARVGLLAAIVAGTGLPAAAQPLRPGEFQFRGGAIACVLTKEEHERAPSASYLPCLRFGPLKLGATMSEIEATLGAPARQLEFQGLPHRLYAVRQNGQPVGYYAVGYRNDRAVVIQKTGKRGLPDHGFSSLNVEDSPQRVIEVLGQPAGRKPVPEIQGELWNWGPFPFTVEIKNGAVYSIRVEMPAAEQSRQ